MVVSFNEPILFGYEIHNKYKTVSKYEIKVVVIFCPYYMELM